MTRDELVENIMELIDESENIALNHEWGMSSDMAEKRLLNNRNSIILEFDHLIAKLESLRWHYPEKGELPKVGRYLTTEWYKDSHIYNIRYYAKDLQNFEVRQITQCYRWRYIE